MAVVEDFYHILQQIHDKDCIHAGSKKTFAMVRINRKSCIKFTIIIHINIIGTDIVFLSREVW